MAAGIQQAGRTQRPQLHVPNGRARTALLTSGCSLRARLRKAFLMSDTLALRGTPSSSYGSRAAAATCRRRRAARRHGDGGGR